jgi:hypothetical protein
MANAPEIIAIALKLKPDIVCLVPERRLEVTTEGGLDVVAAEKSLTETRQKMNDAGIEVSLFIAPDEKQIAASARTGSQFIELHTGSLRNIFKTRKAQAESGIELQRLIAGAAGARARPEGERRPRLELRKSAGAVPRAASGGIEHRPQPGEPRGFCRPGRMRRARNAGGDAPPGNCSNRPVPVFRASRLNTSTPPSPRSPLRSPSGKSAVKYFKACPANVGQAFYLIAGWQIGNGSRQT